MKKRAAATGFDVTSLYASSAFLKYRSGLNVIFLSAKYMQIGWFMSAGDRVINQDGAPTCGSGPLLCMAVTSLNLLLKF